MKKSFFLIILVLISIIPIFDLFHPGLPVTHDGQDHIARIANFYISLQEGNIIPRWAANLNFGYGHPILMFLYPLPSYLSSLFHFLGLSFVDSFKLVFGLTFIGSGLAFYLWTKSFLSKEAACVGAMLYLFAPYRFIDMYVRGAFGEHVAFLFVPLVLFFMLKLSKNYSWKTLAGGSFSFAGLVLSHNAISLMFFPIIFLYGLYLYWESKKNFKSVFLMLGLGFGLSAFFWIPAFFEGKYTLRDIVTANEYKTRFVEFKDFIYGAWNYGGTNQFTKQLGIIQLFFLILSFPLVLFKNKNKLHKLLLGTIIVLFLSLFLMTSSSVFIWDHIKTLQNFQFPWRLLSISVFATSLVGALVVERSGRYKLFFWVITLISVLFFTKDYWRAISYRNYPQFYFTGIYKGTTDTGESSPIWSVRFMEKEPKNHLEIIKGKGTVLEVKRTSTFHQYLVKAKENSRFRENTLYFPGWEVLVDGNKASIEFQDQLNRGLITFNANKGDHSVIVKFVDTKLRVVSNFLSLASLILFFSLARFKNI